VRGASDLVDGVGGVALINAGVPAVAAVERAARHPFAAQVGGMMGCAVPAGRWGQSEGSTTPRVGVMTCTTRTGQLFG
jgi:hypothetical protein